MAWLAGQLPITLKPIPGEALDSWLEAYARRLHACCRDLLNHIGLTESSPSHMVTALTEQERQILSEATGVDDTTLTAMTLQPFHGIAVTVDSTRRILVHPPAWRRQTGSRFCPACLRQNRGGWQLWWRLPWAFACPTHACLLVDYCPGCRRRPTPHRSGTQLTATAAGQCTRSRPNTAPSTSRAQLCGHPLTETATTTLPSNGLVLAAQQRINHLLAAATASDDPQRRHRICRTLGELHTLAYRSLTAHAGTLDKPEIVRTVLTECGGLVPTPKGALDSYDAHTIAVATTIATLAHQHTATGQQLLAWIINTDRQRRSPAEPHRILKPWNNASPALIARALTILDPHIRSYERLAYGSASSSPRLPDATEDQIRRRVASLPALLWPTWTLRMIPISRTGPNTITSTRAALAVLSLIPGTRLTVRQAVGLLGSHTTSSSASTALSALPEEQRTATIAILTDLARTLDAQPAPINYTRRRNLFGQCTVDRRAYAKLAVAHGWLPPSPLQLRILDDHLAIQLTGSHATHRTGPPGHSYTAEAWNPLAVALPLPVREFVYDQARRLLHRHHIREPTTWHPKLPTTTNWPGIAANTIDADSFARAFAAHAAARDGLARICETTGLTSVQVRLYSHIVDLAMSEQQWQHLADDCDHGILDPAGLQHLYHAQQLSLTDIARQSLTSERVVRQTLTNAGTTLLRQRPRTKSIPAEWFQQYYLNTGKTVRQAAADAGISRNTFAKYARQHHIPTGPNSSGINPFANWPRHKQPPPAVIAACSSPHGLDYIRQVLEMRNHPTRRAAAHALGLREQALYHHRQHVERAAGITIFHPKLPLTPTPEGSQFLDHAAQALQRLNHSGPENLEQTGPN